MTGPRLGVAIPVGPLAHHTRYLDEALESVYRQTYPVEDVLLIDDMQGLDEAALRGRYGANLRVWYAPWHIGVAHAFNAGVALGRGEWTLMMGADDWLEPGCFEAAAACIEAREREAAYYWLDIRYADTGEDQGLPCNAAFVNREYWRLTGGIPTEAASGAGDAALVSIVWLRSHDDFPAGKLRRIATPTPQYIVRRHAEQDTAVRGPWQGVILATRDLVTALWEPPQWGRYEPREGG